MRSATHRVMSLALAMAVIGAAASGAGQRLSNTRSASCLVRITADADILPLNPGTVESLLYTSGVAGNAARDVLGPDSPERAEEFIEVEWLSEAFQSTTAPSTPPPPSYDDYDTEMMKELQDIYRSEYMTQLGAKEPATGQPEDEARENLGERPSPSDGRSSSGTRGRSESGRMTGGGGMGGYGSRMMGGMGGYGSRMMGGMGGYGGGMGMGGMMDRYGMGGPGGMMGRYGMGGMMGGMGGFYGGPARPTTGQAVEQSITVRLEVRLPAGAKPAAKEFLEQLVANLEKTLRQAYEMYKGGLAESAADAEERREYAQTKLDEAMGIRSPERMAIEQQLDMVVDLSMLFLEMPFGDAVGELSHSVEPPLQIAVMWRELLENAEVEPTTPIDMDPLFNVKLRTALELLLKAVSGGFAEVSYKIKDDAIIVATLDTLEWSQEMMSRRPAANLDVETLAARQGELSRQAQRLEMDLISGEARREAIQKQIEDTRNLLQHRLDDDEVTRELERLVQMSTERLAALEKLRGPNVIVSESEMTALKERLVGAKIDLAQRRETLSRSAGGGQLDKLGSELSQMSIDMAERRAQLDVLRRQLEQVQWQFGRASTFDPKAARIRIAKQALDMAERRVIELRTRLASLRAPTVTTIGAD